MNKAVITGIDKSYDYTGKDIRPAATLTYKANKNALDFPMVENVHYTVRYEKNKEKGTATVIFSGLARGGFSGVKKQNFKIAAVDLKEFAGGDVTTDKVEINFKDEEHIKDSVYETFHLKGGAKPKVSVTCGDITLEEGKDYTLSYINNKKPALSTERNAPAIRINGKGNFKGEITESFNIVSKTLSGENGITVAATDKVENGKKMVIVLPLRFMMQMGKN